MGRTFGSIGGRRARRALLAGCAAGGMLLAGAAAAEPVTLDIAGPVETVEVAFDCRLERDAAPTPLTVRYVNAPANNLAILPVDGEERVFVRAISASGVKFVSREMVWWAKGQWAHLYDVRHEADGSGRTVCVTGR